MNTSTNEPEVAEPAEVAQSSRDLLRTQKATRLLCMMSIFAFVAFGFVDPFMVEGSIMPLLQTRLVCVLGGILLLLASKALPMRRYQSLIGSLVTIWTGCGVTLLTEQTGGADSAYWPMVMLTFFTVSTVLPMKPWQAAINYATVALFFDIWLLSHDATSSSADWAGSNAGIWLAGFVSVVAVAFLDRTRLRESKERESRNLLNAKLLTQIDERKRAEKVVQRSQQLDAVGQLAAGLAHEINNVLMVISASAEAIQQDNADLQKRVDRIVSSAQRGGRLTSGLLLFAREGMRDNRPFSINKVVNGVASIIDQAHRGRVQTVLTLCTEPAWVRGDEQLFSQVVLNLCLNGVDAMDESGVLRIETRVAQAEEGERRIVELEVVDTGKGMSTEEQERAFEPFFTTKPPGKGTGLGLSIAYGIVSKHEGEITIKSAAGQGCRVTIALPRINAPVTQLVQRERGGQQLPTASFLLVDDDQMVRDVMKEGLEVRGSKVVEARDGSEALSIYRANQESFDIVILDMVMPGMGGAQVFRRIRELNADQAVIIYSGFAQDESVKSMLATGACRFIRKPFRSEDFIQLVKDVLSS